MVVVQLTGGERSQTFAVHAVWRGSALFDDIALIQFHFDFTGHGFFGRLDKGLQGFPQWCEPLAFVCYIRISGGNDFFEGEGIAVGNQFF